MQFKNLLLKGTLRSLLLILLLFVAGITNAQNGNITFADPAVKAICVANWDGILGDDPDGELTYAEAAAVTELGGMFSENDEITSFNELQYFTGLTSIPACAFYRCTGLTSIIIPNGVDYIGEVAFFGCTSLTSINIPNSVTALGTNPFVGCSALASITVEAGNVVLDSRDNCNAIIITASNVLYSGCMNTVIPSTVTYIGYHAFNGCTNLTSINIPSGVTYIDYNAFYGCTGLTSITIPDGVTSISNGTFYGCTGLTSVTLPSGLTTIGNDAFFGCTGLLSVTIPSGVTTIGNNAFIGCMSLSSLTIPSNVTTIGYTAFAYCNGLTSITVEATTPPTLGTNAFQNVPTGIIVNVPCGTKALYQAASGWNTFTNFVDPCGGIVFDDPAVETLCLANWDGILGDTPNGELSYLEAAAVNNLGLVFYGNTEITSFNELQYFTGLTSIGGLAFGYCSGLTSVILPSSVTSIDFEAFADCSSLTSITIPSSVTSISNNPFKGCSALASITVDAGNTRYDSRDNCNAIIKTSTNHLVTGCKNTVIPAAVTSIGHSAFYGCTDMTSVTLPSGLTSINIYAFSSCTGLTSVTLPNSLTSLGSYAFMSCSSLTSITIPSSITQLSANVFNECTGLTSVELPNTLTSIGEKAFFDCVSLASITLPSGLTSIGNSAFYNCTSLESITFPSSLVNIYAWAFNNCTGLTSITVEATMPPTLEDYAFYLVNTSILVYVPCGHYDAYYIANWGGFTNFVENCNIVFADANVKTLCVANWDTNGDNELSYSEAAAVTTLNISGNPSPSPFYETNITSFDELQYFTGLTSICDEAFYHCNNLVSVTLPGSVTTIGNAAFIDCTSLTSINIPNGVTTIALYAFCRCTSLPSIVLPSTVTAINDDAFQNCTGLTSITTEATTPPALGDDVFRDVPADIPVYVPCGTKAAYQVASGWNTFTNFVDPCEAIDFADANVKAICVANWDGNGDGELSYGEAAAVTQLGLVFRNNSVITSFNELQYFTGLTQLYENEFRHCTNLTSILIPNGVTIIGNYAFQSCTSLTSIILPSSVIHFDVSSFSHLYALESVSVDPDNLYYDSRNDCNAIIETSTNELLVGSNNTVIPNTVTSIGFCAFYGCAGLTSITLPSGLTTIKAHAFNHCTGLTSLTIPSEVNSIDAYAFNFCRGLTSITVEATTPPTLGTDAFGYVPAAIPVYVPCESLSAYQNASGWSAFTNIIDPCATEVQTIELSAGFNWFSTYIEMDPMDLLQAFEAAVGDNVLTIESQDAGSTENFGGFWLGDLEDYGMMSEQMYMVYATADCTVALEGEAVTPGSHPITLNNGYTWIGFPCSEETDIMDALAGFEEAEEGDQIEGVEGVTEYLGDGLWLGELATLVPGQGYMYYSVSADPKILVFQTGGSKARAKAVSPNKTKNEEKPRSGLEYKQ